jgi:hypothetical protein
MHEICPEPGLVAAQTSLPPQPVGSSVVLGGRVHTAVDTEPFEGLSVEVIGLHTPPEAGGAAVTSMAAPAATGEHAPPLAPSGAVMALQSGIPNPT